MVWYKPGDKFPEANRGDRVLVIVKVINPATAMDETVILTLQYRGNGKWFSLNPLYDGYRPSDGEYWAFEQDVVASVLKQSEANNV